VIVLVSLGLLVFEAEGFVEQEEAVGRC
jgi:hypothetical protein